MEQKNQTNISKKFYRDFLFDFEKKTIAKNYGLDDVQVEIFNAGFNDSVIDYLCFENGKKPYPNKDELFKKKEFYYKHLDYHNFPFYLGKWFFYERTSKYFYNIVNKTNPSYVIDDISEDEMRILKYIVSIKGE